MGAHTLVHLVIKVSKSAGAKCDVPYVDLRVRAHARCTRANAFAFPDKVIVTSSRLDFL